MNTDRSLSAFAGRFVPVKLTTDGNPEWSGWARKYPTEGRAIPILYVVRADGEMLYGKSGPLPGDALPKMLLATLQQSGRGFTEAETLLLDASVKEATAAMTEEDHMAAAKSLSRLSELGTVGDLKSYSLLAMQADTLAKDVSEKAEASIKEAVEKLNDPQTAFDGVLELVEGETAYAGFNDVRLQVASALRDVKKNSDLQDPLRQAETLVRARRFAESENATIKRRANGAYEQLITSFPGTKAEKIAREELAVIDNEDEVLDRTAGGDEPEESVRTWSDESGKFTIEATYVQQKQGFVQLRKQDGELLAVPISKLSQRDQDYLKQRQ